jgi:glycosyltransferase involved in cell wall biosynthesis
MRIGTCTPLEFEADSSFFSRDTGLLCRGFQMAGHDSISIMTGTAKPNDPSDLVRCSHECLEDSEWWKNLSLDLVILYAWGNPRYRPIAKAIRGASVVLIQNLDCAVFPSPYTDFEQWLNCIFKFLKIENSIIKKLRIGARAIRDFFPFAFETGRLDMIAESDFVSCVTPQAKESFINHLNALERPQIGNKTIVLPHPVSPLMNYCGETKANTLVVVGRWSQEDHAQKNPSVTLKTIHEFLKRHPSWNAKIIGRSSMDLIRTFTNDWDSAFLKRVSFTSHIAHDELRKVLAYSKISLCVSNFESFHIASAEAVCCGCSIVVPRHPLLNSTAWFTTMASGTMAKSHAVSDIADAIDLEINQWANGFRAPATMSAKWHEQLHADKITRNLLNNIKL